MPNPNSPFSYLGGALDEALQQHGIFRGSGLPDVETLMAIYHTLVPSLHPEDHALNQPILLSGEEGWREKDRNKLYL